jgi:ABC-type lipoprotein export system ATPase subunit
VNALIKELHEIIKSRKPWVRFGISPFGIYRNQKSDPDGSATNGLQNYDQLYADVLLWTRNGWVDYMLPQLYWEIGHQAACVETLIYWWNNHANGRHLYIGQDVARTMNATDVNPIYTQLNHKMQLSRYLDHVGGNCFWPGYSLLENYKGIADDLKGYYHAVPSLIPAYTFIDGKDIFSMNDKKLTVFRRRNIGFIFQAFNLVPELTVEQNIIFPVLLDYQKPDKKYLEELLAVLNLKERRNHLPSQLSGGQQQRVAIGRALITRPALILADEPTGNLDTQNSSEVIALLKEASKKYEQTIIMITHNRSIAQTADRVLQVSDGVLTDFGRCRE